MYIHICTFIFVYICSVYKMLDRFRFCETYFTTHQRFVADQSAMSSFLGGYVVYTNWRESASPSVRRR